MTLRLFLGLCLGLLATAAAAQGPKSPTPTELDKIANEVLKDVHNRGAELYNTGDPAACYRMYQGALLTVKPFLAHRPAVQQTIAAGLEEVSKSADDVKTRAFRLHEVIEKARDELKAESKKAEPDPKAKEPAPKPKEPEPKPNDPVAKPKDPQPAVAPKAGDTTGKVTMNGQPLAGAEVMFVSLKLAAPRVFVATTGADGTYKLTGPVPAGEYAVKVTGASVPAKFQEFAQSGVRVEAKDGASTFDLDLKSK
jgi:hypothetical protein